MENQIPKIKKRIVICGNSSVGKSNLLLRYMKDHFEYNYRTTIGVDYFTKDFQKNNLNISIQFFDTAGQEKYQALSCNYYRLSDGIIIVYDVTNRKSFENCKFWQNEILKSQTKKNIILLIGNKIDLIQERTVNLKEGEQFARENGLFFMETSAKSNQGECVNKAFGVIIDEIIEKTVVENREKLKEELDILKKQSIVEFRKNTKKGCC